jgi:hypothetical protein
VGKRYKVSREWISRDMDWKKVWAMTTCDQVDVMALEGGNAE